MTKCLYITYDGLCSPLGASQILPYILGLEEKGHAVVILSMEEPGQLARNRSEVMQALKGRKVHWYHLTYSRRPWMMSKLKDLRAMRRTSRRLHRKYDFNISHCRSYVAAQVGSSLKHRFRVPFIFDMRGFWADERVEGGMWPQHSVLYRQLYKRYKRLERRLLRESRAVVSLTDRAVQVMREEGMLPLRKEVHVIPCCADPALFHFPSVSTRQSARRELGLESDHKVMVYHGSFGTWYMLEEMMMFAGQAMKRWPEFRLLVITHSDHQMVREAMARHAIEPQGFILRSATRGEIPFYLSAADMGWYFIRPGFSKQASSPTKLGELLMMGLPVLCNAGIGDSQQQVEELGAGRVMDIDDKEQWLAAIQELPKLCSKRGKELAERSRSVFDLSLAVERYQRVYALQSSEQDVEKAA